MMTGEASLNLTEIATSLEVFASKPALLPIQLHLNKFHVGPSQWRVNAGASLTQELGWPPQWLPTNSPFDNSYLVNLLPFSACCQAGWQAALAPGWLLRFSSPRSDLDPRPLVLRLIRPQRVHPAAPHQMSIL